MVTAVAVGVAGKERSLRRGKGVQPPGYLASPVFVAFAVGTLIHKAVGVGRAGRA